MEGGIMKRGALLPRVGSLVLLLGSGLGWAGQYDEKERAELAQALKGTKLSLKQGIVASASKGKPISAKFEVEDGKLQLSVYTAKGGQFSEVAVDPKSGRVAKVEAIKGGEDLTAAKAQADAMAKAKTPLGGAVDAAVKKHPGFRPVSVIPALKDGHPVADVTLIKGDELKTASEGLD
jgi:hypothetical protein